MTAPSPRPPRRGPRRVAGRVCAWLVALAAGCGGGGGGDVPAGPAPSPSLSTVTPSAATVVADGAGVATVEVHVVDGAGVPLEGWTVRLAVSGSDNLVDQPDPTDASGRAVATVASTRAETKTLVVTVGDGPGATTLATQPTIEFLADASNLSASLSEATATPAGPLAANGTEASTIEVVVRDANGNPVPGRTVELAASGAGSVLVQPGAPTDADGRASGTLASNVQDLKTVTATVDPAGAALVLEDAPVVEFLADASSLSAVLSSVSAAPDSFVVADGVEATTVTVTVRDGHGSPVPGQTVLLTTDGSDDVLTQPAVVTDAFGVATGALRSTHAEVKTIRATVNPGTDSLLLVETAPVLFIGDAEALDAGLSSVTATPTANVVANGTTTTTLTAVVRDVNGNPVPDRTVRFASSGTDDTIVQPAAVTGIDGVAVGTLASTKAEVKTITVTVDPGPDQLVLADAPAVEFVGDPDHVDPDLSTATATPALDLIADGVETATVDVVVRDRYGNVVEAQAVELASDGTDDVLAQPAPSDELGATSGTLASTRAETKTLTVTVNPGPDQVVLTDAPTVEFEGDPSTIDAALSSATVAPADGVVANGSDEATVDVVVRDVNGNVVEAQAVALASDGTSDALTQPGATGDDGAASGALASTHAETKTLTVTVNPGPSQVVLADQPTVRFVGDPDNIDPALSTVTASPQLGVVANGASTSTVTVVLRDVNGNLVEDTATQVAASGTANAYAQPPATDQGGTAAGAVSSTKAESKTLTVTARPGPDAVVLDDRPTVEFVADVTTIDADLSSAVAAPATDVVADGVETATVTVVVRDAWANPVPAQAVQLASDGSNDTLVQPDATDAAGTTSGTLASTTAESKSVTVTVNPGPSQVVLTARPSVAFVGDPSTLDADLSTASAFPTTGVVADGTTAATIDVVARDVNGNVVEGQAVQLASDGTANSLGQPSATDAAGTTSGTLATTKAETKTVTVTLNPGPSQVVLTARPTVAFVGDPENVDPDASTVSASPATDVVADGVEASTVDVVVLDVNGNVVPGVTVQLSANGAENSFAQPSPTDAAGATSGTLASTEAETKTVTVTVNPGPAQAVLTDRPTVEFVGDPSNVDSDLSSVVASPSSGVVADGAASSTVTITLRDVNGNVIEGVASQLAVSGANNGLAQPGPSDATGVATGALDSTTAETKTVTVTVDPGGLDLVLTDRPTVEFVGDAANVDAGLSTVVASPSSGVVADGTTASTVTITLRDANGNLVEGVASQIASDGSANALVQPGASDVNGVASGTLATTTAETKTLTVTVDPGGAGLVLDETPTVEFVSDPDSVSAALSTLDASPADRVAADGVEEIALTATIRDANGNPVAGLPVEFTVTGSGNVVTPNPATAAADGTATAALTSTVAEAKTVTATVKPGPDQIVLDDVEDVSFTWRTTGKRYVRTSGDDANDGESPAQAWRTIDHAASQVTAGTTVFVGGGTYAETVSLSNDGTASEPIELVADPSGDRTGDAGTVLIDGTGGDDVVTIQGDHVVLEGFTITGGSPSGSEGAGVRVGDAPTDGVVIRGNTIYTNRRGIFAYRARNLRLEDNVIRSHAGTSSLAWLGGGDGGEGVVLSDVEDSTLLNNLIYDNASHGVLATDGTTGVDVLSNTFYANGAAQVRVDGLLNSVVVRDNIVSEGFAAGISLSVGSLLASSYNDSWGNPGLDFLGLPLGLGDLSLQPLLLDPFGPDGLLGEGGDDDFTLDPLGPSPAFDAGSGDAEAVVFSDGTTLADRSSRADGLLDGDGADGAATNLGFHYPATTDALPELAPTHVRALFGVADRRRPRVATRGTTTWSSAALAPPTGAPLRWARHAVSRIADEDELALVQIEDGAATELACLRWSGVAWYEEWTAAGVDAVDAHRRTADLVTLAGGDALAVWSDGTHEPRFRRLSQGEWTDAAAVFTVAPGVADVAWVRLEASPDGGEALLVYADTASDLHALVWDGAVWDEANVATLETALAALDTRAFDVAFEAQSGAAVVAWTGPATRYATRAAGATSWSAASPLSGLGSSPVTVDLGADPSSDRIAFGGLDDAAGGDDLSVATWTGTAWVDPGTLESGAGSTRGALAGDANVAAGWSPVSDEALVVYADEAGGALHHARWASGAGWTLEADLAVAGMGLVESARLESLGVGLGATALVSDASGALRAFRYDGAAWSADATLTTSLTTAGGAPFDLAVGR